MRISDWSSDVCSSDLLSAYATKARLEEWAGTVAGSSALHNRGIARSTLHDWQKRGQVVALLAGARKHAFPLEQFVDGRPMEGIADVLEVVGNPRRAWSWMVERSPLLAGKRPIDLLKQDRRRCEEHPSELPHT